MNIGERRLSKRVRLTEVLRTIRPTETGSGQAPAPARAPEPAGVSEILVAGTRALRERAWAFVHDTYVSKGYMEPCPTKMRILLQDALPEATTFLAEERASRRALATLTIYPDGAMGLPMDALYRRELDALRAAGRRPCEIAKLVADIDVGGGRRVLLDLFRLAYLAARRLEACTDLVVTVNPRHEKYYRRLLMFERIGEEKPYDSVQGAPAVPLRLDLDKAERRYKERSDAEGGQAGFYGFFLNSEAEGLLDWLRQERLPMTVDEFRHFFVRRTHLLDSASERNRMLLEACYCAGRPDPRPSRGPDGIAAKGNPALTVPAPARN